MTEARAAWAALAAAVVLGTAGAAGARLSDAVLGAFRGKIVLSRGAVAPGASDKETIARLRAAQLTELVGASTGEGRSWAFHYTAFLKKAGNLGLELRFVSGDQDGRVAAEVAVPIPDVDSPVLTGDLKIGESRGLSRGKAYLLELVNDQGELVAKTSAIFK